MLISALPCHQVLHKSAWMAHLLAQFGWASFPCRPAHQGPSSHWWQDWPMCGGVVCASVQRRTETVPVARKVNKHINYRRIDQLEFGIVIHTTYVHTCLKISSVTRWTPRCCGLKCIFLCSQAGWPTMRPCPRPEPEPLLWLAEQAIPLRPLLRWWPPPPPLPPPPLPLWLQKAAAAPPTGGSGSSAAVLAAALVTSSASTLASTCWTCLWLRPASLPRYVYLVGIKYGMCMGTNMTR